MAMKRKSNGAADTGSKGGKVRGNARGAAKELESGDEEDEEGGSNSETIETLSELLVDELKDLYSAEQQLTKALPRMAKKAKHPELKQAIQDHLGQTEGHVKRLEQVFKLLGEKPKAKTCKAMQGLLAEGKELMGEDMDDDSMDAAIIAAAQKVEHYEIASYGTVRTWARRVGHDDAADLLQETLDEEGEADKLLTQIAEDQVNADAAS